METVSAMNWLRMSICLAPTARRSPISRVRSSTVASMMFMMPIPPTRSEIPAMQAMTMVKMFCVLRCCSSSASGTIIS